jgi:hypothetical protein
VLFHQYFCFHTFFISFSIAEQRRHTRWSLDNGLTMGRHSCDCEQPFFLILFLHHYFFLYFNIWLTLVTVFQYEVLRCCLLMRICKLLQVRNVTNKQLGRSLIVQVIFFLPGIYGTVCFS